MSARQRGHVLGDVQRYPAAVKMEGERVGRKQSFAAGEASRREQKAVGTRKDCAGTGSEGVRCRAE